jgi:F0F1-type ATP synthase membrane subunit c/vacuolar-type H+-ATPase subunit K
MVSTRRERCERAAQIPLRGTKEPRRRAAPAVHELGDEADRRRMTETNCRWSAEAIAGDPATRLDGPAKTSHVPPEDHAQTRSAENRRTREDRVLRKRENCHPSTVFKRKPNRDARQSPQPEVRSSDGFESAEPQNQLLGVANSMFKRDPSKQGRPLSPAVWIALGVAIGCGLGVAVGNLPIGVGLGIAVGGIVALVSRRRNDPPNS